MPKLNSYELTDYEKQWLQTIKEWKAANPPDHAGYWYCRMGGGSLTDGRQDAMGGLSLNLCHDISRVRDKTQRYRLSNIFAGCSRHNRQQGSQSFKEYLATNPHKRCGN